MYPYPLSCLDYASMHHPQIQPSFRVNFGLLFVHLTKFHRRSESFFGAHLFSIAIWTHLCMVSTNMGKMLPRYTQILFAKNGIWAVLGCHGSVWAETRCIRTQIALWTSFPKPGSEAVQLKTA